MGGAGLALRAPPPRPTVAVQRFKSHDWVPGADGPSPDARRAGVDSGPRRLIGFLCSVSLCAIATVCLVIQRGDHAHRFAGTGAVAQLPAVVNFVTLHTCDWEQAFLLSLLADTQLRHIDAKHVLGNIHGGHGYYRIRNHTTVAKHTAMQGTVALVLPALSIEEEDLRQFRQSCNYLTGCRGFDFDRVKKRAALKTRLDPSVQTPDAPAHVLYQKPSQSEFARALHEEGVLPAGMPATLCLHQIPALFPRRVMRTARGTRRK